MTTVVLVHGIAQEQKSADTLEQEWLPNLAGGVRTAGFPDIADRLYRARSGSEWIESRMAFYGDLFLKNGQQSLEPDPLTEREQLLAERLAVEWMSRAASRSTNERARWVASQELAQVQGVAGKEQGVGAGVRSAVNGLSRIRWFAPFGIGFAQRFVMRSLSQVTRYFSDDDLRARAVSRVLDLIGTDTNALIGHSLGSVVAFEAAHTLVRPLPLLITLGCPLGLHSVVYERVHPQPPRFPPKVRRWVNVADRDDIVAAEPNLTALFSASAPPGSVLEGGYTVDNGAKPHSADFYLTKVEVGRPIAETLSIAG